MRRAAPFENSDLKHLQLFVYLVPVLGVFPAIWTLYRRNGDRAQRSISRLAVTLAFGWLMGYLLLGVGSQSDGLTLPLLIMSSLLTSGYFLLNLWLMVRLWQRRSLWLPGISDLSDRLP